MLLGALLIMAARGSTWGEEEVKVLLAIWGDEKVQKLIGIRRVNAALDSYMYMYTCSLVSQVVRIFRPGVHAWQSRGGGKEESICLVRCARFMLLPKVT